MEKIRNSMGSHGSRGNCALPQPLPRLALLEFLDVFLSHLSILSTDSIVINREGMVVQAK